MDFTLNLAFKNIFRQKKRSFTLGINYTIVTLVLVILFSFSEGAKVNITSNLIQSSAGHLTVSGEYITTGRVYLGVKDYPRVTDILEKHLGKEIVSIFPRYTVYSAVYYKGLSKRLQFTGISPQMDQNLMKQLVLKEGSWKEFLEGNNGVVIPEEVQEYFGLAYGDEILISTRTRFGAFNTGVLKVVGIHQTGNYFARGLVLSHFSFLQRLDLASEDTATNLYVYVNDIKRLKDMREKAVSALNTAGFETSKPKSNEDAIAAVTAASSRYSVEKGVADKVRLTVSTVDEVLGIVTTIINAVNGIGSLIAGVLLFIIAISIFINLRMTIIERLREIGTMRTIGMEAGGVTFLFMVENVLLAGLFLMMGVVVSLSLISVFNTLVSFPMNSAFSLFLRGGHLVLVPRLVDILAIGIVILGLSALFSYFPARKGGRIRPVEALTRVF